MIAWIAIIFTVIMIILAMPQFASLVVDSYIIYKHKKQARQEAEEWQRCLDGLADKYVGTPRYGPEEYVQPQRWKHYPDAINNMAGSYPILLPTTCAYLGHKHYRKETDND